MTITSCFFMLRLSWVIFSPPFFLCWKLGGLEWSSALFRLGQVRNAAGSQDRTTALRRSPSLVVSIHHDVIPAPSQLTLDHTCRGRNAACPGYFFLCSFVSSAGAQVILVTFNKALRPQVIFSHYERSSDLLLRYIIRTYIVIHSYIHRNQQK